MELRSFVLCNAKGDEVCISNYGARILQWHTDVDGEERNIVLGYSSLNDYQSDPAYLGAIAGPFANRIGGAQFEIDDEVYQLDANDGLNHLHGGRNSISDMEWEVEEQSEQALTLSCQLEDGFNGYPGAMTFKVVYRLDDESTLIIDFYVTTEKATVVGPTSHPYFNLAGMGNDHKNHVLQIFAENYTTIDDKNIPTGEIAPVGGTALDFRQPRILSSEADRDNIDHNFTVQPNSESAQAILISPDKKLQLHVRSDYPGLQIYTGHGLDGKFEPKSGICLEPQFYPNSPNIDNFPFTLTTPEEPFKSQIRYQLVTMEVPAVANENEQTNRKASQPVDPEKMDNDWQL